MRLEWSLASGPTAKSGYHTITEAIGTISLTVDQTPFLTLQDIMILEFAYFVRKWLNEVEAGCRPNFYYKSMDEEEEPLFALNINNDKYYILESCWSSARVRAVEHAEVLELFNNFITELKEVFLVKHGVNIDDVLPLLG